MSANVDGLSVDGLRVSGLLPHSSWAAEVVERYGVPGSMDAARVLESRVTGGFDHEVLASRGLDIGYAAWRGVPLAWRSPVRDARPLDRPTSRDWLSRFTGGLLTTCGPFAIGEDVMHGLHGDFSHRPATQVTGRAEGSRTLITGTVEAHSVFGPSLTIERSIESDAGADLARIVVTDIVRNTGPVPSPLSMLYHVNLGPPLAVPGSTVAVTARSSTARETEDDILPPSPLPTPTPTVGEAVYRYDELEADADGWCHARVSRPGSRIDVDVAWRLEGLPYVHQWIYPTLGRWAVALEPASTALFGAGSTAAVLAPGEHRRHSVMITADGGPSRDC